MQRSSDQLQTVDDCPEDDKTHPVEPTPRSDFTTPSGSSQPQIPESTGPIADISTDNFDTENDVLTTDPTKYQASPSENLQPEEAGHNVSSDQVNDKIVHHFAELERDRASATAGQVLGDITQVKVTNISREPIIVNHTELTPIMETSPRESMASDYAEQINNAHPASSKRGSSPPITQSSSIKRPTTPVSPVVSIQSEDRARSASLTSQAERLRNKFLIRKASSESDSTAETSTTPGKLERRMKFENLIRSGETMKMSLTPTTLRTIEVLLEL